MSYPFVFIEFQTKSNDISSWNTLKIERADGHIYRVTLKNTCTKNNEVTELYYAGLEKYMRHVLTSITYDECKNDRINNIQFDVPCFPSIIVSIDRLPDYIPVFIEQLEILSDTWPTKYKIGTSPPVTVKDDDEDEDDDDEDDDDEDDDETESIEPRQKGRIGYEYD